jgi:glycerol-3-phosphate O-acyltransferase / dihydroxyacetone phosphate acyltransferase
MLYALLRLVVKIALRVFYTNVEVKTKAPIPAKGPLIVVANHPNTFMDPIVIASILPQQVYFLTNGSVFKNPVIGWLLGKMNMIPIYRKQDIEGQTPDNRASTGLLLRNALIFWPTKAPCLFFQRAAA